MSNSPVKKAKKPPTDPKRWCAEARTEASGLIRKQPIRWAFRFLICFLFIAVLLQEMVVHAFITPVIALAAIAYFILTGYRLLQPMFATGREVREWALEEQEHITMAHLTGKNQEELEQLLQYHMKYGNVQEADRISQKLLALVDKDNFSDPALGDPTQQSANQIAASPATAAGSSPANAATADDPGVVIKVSPGSTLPNWLRDDEDAGAQQPQPGADANGKKLPDWMN